MDIEIPSLLLRLSPTGDALLLRFGTRIAALLASLLQTPIAPQHSSTPTRRHLRFESPSCLKHIDSVHSVVTVTAGPFLPKPFHCSARKAHICGLTLITLSNMVNVYPSNCAFPPWLLPLPITAPLYPTR